MTGSDASLFYLNGGDAFASFNVWFFAIRRHCVARSQRRDGFEIRRRLIARIVDLIDNDWSFHNDVSTFWSRSIWHWGCLLRCLFNDIFVGWWRIEWCDATLVCGGAKLSEVIDQHVASVATFARYRIILKEKYQYWVGSAYNYKYITPSFIY